MKLRKWFILLSMFMILVACGGPSKDQASEADFIAEGGDQTLRIVSGSENKELQPMIEKFAQENHISIEMDYLGSLDIMRLLQSDNIQYDAVWPASSIWLTMGDTHHRLKYTETTSISPIAFGIKESKAKALGWIDKDDVKISDIIEAIQSKKLKFAMTSASQSNSGASAYLGFLSAIAKKSDDVISKEDLQNQSVQTEIKKLLSGVNRSSGSSNWLVDLFLQGDYDAMVNYETLIIQTNLKLQEQGREPLYLIYPEDGLAISDSPLAYVDNGDAEKEKLFNKFQEYVLSEKGQSQIEETGKRSAFGTVTEANQKIFKKEWGIDLNKVLEPIKYPAPDVIMESLTLYQTQFKKPALTYYVLDYSGSMDGKGNEQLLNALEQVMIPENAAQNLLQGTSNDRTYIVPFNSSVMDVHEAKGNGKEMKALYDQAQSISPDGGTALFLALDQTLTMIEEDYANNLSDYTPMIVILSDGMATDAPDQFNSHYQSMGMDIPIFSIMFGNAEEDQLKELANLSNGRVFDGREDLIKAFQSVKGYN